MKEMENTEVVKELSMETKITVRSLANWTTGFQRIESTGDVTITPNGTTRLSRGEVISQVQNGNMLFTGIDGVGSHATLYIEDADTREELDFDNKKEKKVQKILTPELVAKLFTYKGMSKTFKDKVSEYIVTSAEKSAVMMMIKKGNYNDYEKIRFIENYTGHKMK